MGTNLKELREHRSTLAVEIRNVMDNNKATWNKNHQKLYDDNMAEIERIDAQIDREEKYNALAVDKAINDIGKKGRHGGSDIDATSERGLFNTWMRQGADGMSAEQTPAFRNALSTTTGSQGGFTVQTDVARELQDALKAYGGVRSVAEVFSTAQGGDIQYPNSDGTSEVGELVAQNTAATAGDLVFGTSTLSAYKFSSKIVTVPFELLQDSTLDIEAIITKRFIDRLGRITNQYFTTGTGTSQPRGVVTASQTGKVGLTGQTTTVIYDDLVDLEHSVDPAYRRLGCKYMMNDATVKVIRKLKDAQGRPMFVPGYEQNAMINGGIPDTLLGTPIVVNQDMPVMAANAKSILFGYFGAYKIRDVMEFTLFRFTDSAYSQLGQVGFLAWMRSGGNFVDVGKSLSNYTNSAT